MTYVLIMHFSIKAQHNRNEIKHIFMKLNIKLKRLSLDVLLQITFTVQVDIRIFVQMNISIFVLPFSSYIHVTRKNVNYIVPKEF